MKQSRDILLRHPIACPT